MRSTAGITLALAVGCLMAGVTGVEAQTRSSATSGTPTASYYLNVDGGAQPQRRTITASDTIRIYDESATVQAVQRIRNSGMGEITGGKMLSDHLGVGVGFSMVGRPGSGVVTATIPSPAFFNRAVTQTKDASGLKHTEQTVTLRLSWTEPLTDKIDVAVSAGPSYILLTQDLATGITVTPNTQDFTVTRTSHKPHTFGANAGVDVNYMLTGRFGVGLFVHYLYGKLDMPEVSDLTVGGVQSGLGLRVRF